MKKPELLAPAGDLEKLKFAITYGADAVYFGGHSLGLRAKAKNFTTEEMVEGIKFAHDNSCRVFVTVNVLAHNDDLIDIGGYLRSLQEIGVDALIISDPGILEAAKEAVPEMELHLSTQANCTNYKSASFWHKQGIKRIVLARELSFNEIKEIRDKTPKTLELESFVHGAMCMSYSGRCLLSNYITDRDSNRGACSQPCRWKYGLVEESRPDEVFPVFEDDRGTFILNSKDLCLIGHIPALLNSGVESLKIEGRMKTAYYTGVTVKAYREAIDDFFTDPELYKSKIDYYMSEVSKCSHRSFTTGFYLGNEGNRQKYETSSYIRNYDFVAVVLGRDEESGLTFIEQRNKFICGEGLEIISPNKHGFETVKITEMYNEQMVRVCEAPHPQQRLWVRLDEEAVEFSMIRKQYS